MNDNCKGMKAKNVSRTAEKLEFTFETKEQLAEFMGLPVSSRVVSALWDDLKADKTTDQAIVRTMQEASYSAIDKAHNAARG